MPFYYNNRNYINILINEIDDRFEEFATIYKRNILFENPEEASF